MVELNAISVNFSQGKVGETAAVDNVSLRIQQGEIFGIVGRVFNELM